MFKLEIDTGNAAFADDLGGEIARALHEAADKVQLVAFAGSNHSFRIFDSNGNGVGSWSIHIPRVEEI